MKRVWRGPNVIEANHLRNVLASAGIESFLRNENLVRLAGEVPFEQTWPEVWLADDRQLDAAVALLEEVRRPRINGPAWSCPQCNEWLEGQFTDCWKCGSPRP